MTADDKMSPIQIVRESVRLTKSLGLPIYADLQNRFPFLAQIEGNQTAGVKIPDFALRDAESFLKIVAKAHSRNTEKETYIPERLQELTEFWSSYAKRKQQGGVEQAD